MSTVTETAEGIRALANDIAANGVDAWKHGCVGTLLTLLKFANANPLTLDLWNWYVCCTATGQSKLLDESIYRAVDAAGPPNLRFFDELFDGDAGYVTKLLDVSKVFFARQTESPGKFVTHVLSSFPKETIFVVGIRKELGSVSPRKLWMRAWTYMKEIQQVSRVQYTTLVTDQEYCFGEPISQVLACAAMGERILGMPRVRVSAPYFVKNNGGERVVWHVRHQLGTISERGLDLIRTSAGKSILADSWKARALLSVVSALEEGTADTVMQALASASAEDSNAFSQSDPLENELRFRVQSNVFM